MHRSRFKVDVHIIPCLKDNYAYVLRLGDSTLLIDAPEALSVIDFLNERDWGLDAVFLTHHHWDHVDGHAEIKTRYRCKSFSSDFDRSRIGNIDEGLKNGEKFQDLQALSLPGHTLGHVGFYFSKYSICFVGDTLFSAGCGRLFEGTPEQMFASLDILKSLPGDTKLYCGHEYTIKNLEFALAHAPNVDVEMYYKTALDRRAKNLPTMPTSVNLELKINPFLKTATVEEFIRLRKLRDQW